MMPDERWEALQSLLARFRAGDMWELRDWHGSVVGDRQKLTIVFVRPPDQPEVKA